MRTLRPIRCSTVSECPPNGHVIESDGWEWTHPNDNTYKRPRHQRHGSRLLHAVLLHELAPGQHANMTPEQVKDDPIQHWWPWVGRPKLVRADQGGCFTSADLQGWVNSQGIWTELVPTDAHWQLPLPDRSIGILKDMMSTLARAAPQSSAREPLGRALAAHNDS